MSIATNTFTPVDPMFRTRTRGETPGMNERDQTHITQDERESTAGSPAARGADDRRGEVRPGDSPAPSSPEPDREAVEHGEEILERVKPY